MVSAARECIENMTMTVTVTVMVIVVVRKNLKMVQGMRMMGKDN